MKYLVLMLLLIEGSFGFTQSDSLTQKQRNEQKVVELREKLKNLSGEEQPNETNSSTILPRLSRMEDLMNEMLLEMKRIKEDGAKKQNEIINQELERRFALLKDSLMKMDYSYSKRQVSENSHGEFYVVVESQKTLSQAKKALEMYSKRSNDELLVLKSKENNWYYLALIEKNSYKQTLKLVNKMRSNDVEDAWWVNIDEIEIVQLGVK